MTNITDIKNAILEALPSNITFNVGGEAPTLRANWNEEGDLQITLQHGGPGNAYRIPRGECCVSIGMEADRLSPDDDEELASQQWIEDNMKYWIEEIQEAMEAEEGAEEDRE